MRNHQKPRRWLTLILSAVCISWSMTAAVLSVDEEQPSTEVAAQLFEGMGPHQRRISTASSETQQYFDQGLTWIYAFNHHEAIRSFLRAAELDPGCAMAWWGVAYCEGPNYNDSVMTNARSKAAWYALQNAMARLEGTSDVERALIEALAKRYANPWPEDRSHLEQAYADAMADVWSAFPDDPDVGALYAESLMVLKPWQLYTPDRMPVEGTETIVATLDRVLQLQPDHPGANHLYIHAVEPSRDPGQALKAAAALDDLVSASGHLLHMPSHIYIQVGQWDRAIQQNVKAMRSDARFRQLAPDHTFQQLYMVHNAHMLAFAAMMSGREDEAMAAARAMWTEIPEPVLREIGPVFDRWMSSVYDVQKRFGRWDAILQEPAPPDYLPVTVAVWRAHRAIAQAAKHDFAAAETEYTKFRQARTSLPPDHMTEGDLADRFLSVSDLFVRGEIALQKGEWELAATLLQEAADIESTLSYGEPPQWLQPVRHTLGAVYLKAKHYEDAERVYREDLAKWPKNGWSLYGLSRALEGQGRTAEAREVQKAYEEAWSRADAPIDTSCKCLPGT